MRQNRIIRVGVSMVLSTGFAIVGSALFDWDLAVSIVIGANTGLVSALLYLVTHRD